MCERKRKNNKNGESNLQFFFISHYIIPANSHALGVSLTPAGWKLRSHARSRLRTNFSRLIEKCELFRLAWHNFQKYVNSDPCKERKPCVKWIDDNIISSSQSLIFEVKSTGSELGFIHWDWDNFDNFTFSRLRTSSEDFGLLWESSEMIVSSTKIPALPG